MWKKKRKNKSLTLVQHLEEFRRRFIISLVWVVVGSVVSWFYGEGILSILKRLLASLFLTRLGLISPHSLRRRRKQAILIIFIISAILTPPDVLTQLFMLGLWLLLYEISTWLSKLVYRRSLLSG